jgi:hypothetical protein
MADCISGALLVCVKLLKMFHISFVETFDFLVICNNELLEHYLCYLFLIATHFVWSWFISLVIPYFILLLQYFILWLWIGMRIYTFFFNFIVIFCRLILRCFITDITLIILWQLIQTPDTTVLGLVFLQTASEELVCPWEDLSVSRKEELRRLFLAHIPQVFTILTGIDFYWYAGWY